MAERDEDKSKNDGSEDEDAERRDSDAEVEDEVEDTKDADGGDAKDADADEAEPARSAPEPRRKKKQESTPPPSARKTAEEGGDVSFGVGLALAVLVPVLFFFVLPPLSRSGLWDPYELNVADLARRIALNLFGADALALGGADNSMPHLNDLGRPELPFTSMAYGFKTFGLHEWAGRAPMAVWGVAGVVATYGFLARLVDRRAGLYAAVALATTPLWFVQARTMMGDIVAMSAFAMAFGGLAVAVFDRRDDAGSKSGAAITPARIGFLVLGVVGAVAGFYGRGGVLGVAAPVGGIGLAWALTWASGRRTADVLGDAVGAIALGAGLWFAWQGWQGLGATDVKNLNLYVGAMLKAPQKYPTFDFYVAHLGHALAPWSAFVPFAFGRLFMPPVGRHGFAAQRESWLRGALVVGAGAALAAHAMLAMRTDLIPFVGVALLAAACGVALRDYERGAHPSIAVAVGTVVLAALFHHDFHEMPEKAYQAFGVVGAVFPESFKEHALVLWWVALGGFALLAFLTFSENKHAPVEGLERWAQSEREPFDPARYLDMLHKLREAWDGLLALAYFAMVAGSSIAGLVIWFGVRAKAAWVAQISLQIRDGVLNAWWLTALVPLAVVFGVTFASDLWLWAFDRATPFTRGSLTRGFEPFEALFGRVQKAGPRSHETWAAVLLVAPFMLLAVPGITFVVLHKQGVRLPIALSLAIPSGIALFLVLGALGDLLCGRGGRVAAFSVGAGVIGFVLCFQYYPALANQLSPKEVFESYERVHAPGEPLALFGVGGRTAAYYAGGQPETLTDAQGAFTWLTAGQGGRRFLAVRTEELPRLNMLYRQRAAQTGKPAANLPVLDARSSQIVLVASALGGGETNQSPLEKIILPSAPKPQHKLDVDMEGKLFVIGYDLTDGNGRFVDSVAPGRKFHLRVYYRVTSAVTTEWEAFIHIDGFHRRHNGDHKVCGGKYPFSLWQKDDVIVDDYEMALEPNFSPGPYTLYFGLYLGDSRLKVTSGPNDGENRINGGPLKVQ